jgi:hypothetical protein
LLSDVEPTQALQDPFPYDFRVVIVCQPKLNGLQASFLTCFFYTDFYADGPSDITCFPCPGIDSLSDLRGRVDLPRELNLCRILALPFIRLSTAPST